MGNPRSVTNDNAYPPKIPNYKVVTCLNSEGKRWIWKVMFFKWIKVVVPGTEWLNKDNIAKFSIYLECTRVRIVRGVPQSKPEHPNWLVQEGTRSGGTRHNDSAQ
jgi:hypothetical protein